MDDFKESGVFMKIFRRFMAFMLSAVLMAALAGCGNNYSKIASPSNLSKKSEEVEQKVQGDYYVSVNGDDSNSGTSPDEAFKTIGKAQQTVRERIAKGDVPEKGLTVSIMAGNYNEKNLVFDEKDSGSEGKPVTYAAYGDGEVILNGGIELKAEDFENVSGEAAERLSEDAVKNVKMVDLSKYNLTKEDYGILYALGAYNTAEYYDGDTTGPNQCELFFNDARLTLARYPNEGNLKTGEVLDIGDAHEPNAPGPLDETWTQRRNQRGGTFVMDDDTYKRVKEWKTLDDVWTFGYFYWDWADMSTPIKSINDDTQSLTTKYCSPYGFKEDCDYYFYNVFEELDAPGEYYIDREANIIYLYPPKALEESDISLSVTTKSVVEITEKASYINLKGLTVQGTRGDGIIIAGTNCNAENCTVKNAAGCGINVSGSKNKIVNCEVKSIGKDAVLLGGGDAETLTPGENVVENCYLHDFGQVQKTYIAGVNISGVGNTASHNEICNAPHMGIYYTGNDNIMEYNNIHDVVLQSSDAGAIYTGFSLSTYGNVVRYNCIYDIGSGEFTPSGIYFDDNSSGQTAHGNILVNIPGYAILVGGGRDNTITNNLVINSGSVFNYDDRAYDGYHNDGWYAKNCKDPDSRLWTSYEEAKALNEKWGHKYKGIDKMHQDYSREDDPGFAVNPAGSIVKNNIIISEKGDMGFVADSVKKYSDVSDNGTYKLRSALKQFEDAENGVYVFKSDSKILSENPDFEQIPFDQIGRK